MATSTIRLIMGAGLISAGLAGWVLANSPLRSHLHDLATDLCVGTVSAGIVLLCVDFVMQRRDDERERRLRTIAIREVVDAMYPLLMMVCNVVKATTPPDISVRPTWEDVLSEAAATRSMHLDPHHEAPGTYVWGQSTPWHEHLQIVSNSTLAHIAELKRAYWQVLPEEVAEALDALRQLPLLKVCCQMETIAVLQREQDFGWPCMLRADKTAESFRMLKGIVAAIERQADSDEVERPAVPRLVVAGDVAPRRGSAIRADTPYVPTAKDGA